MKKTALFGLAVMATATLLAVESKNIVGYKSKPVANNVYNFFVATFDKIGQNQTYTLRDIGINEDFVYSTLAFLNENAGTKVFTIDGLKADTFSYYTEADLEEDEDFKGKPGWYYVDDDMNLHDANDIEVPYGAAFYVEGGDDGAAVVFSGNVAAEDTPVDVENNVYNFTGNVSPVNLTLGDITVNESFVYSTLAFLNENAGTKVFTIDELSADSFSYYTEADLEEDENFKGMPGWYYVDDDMNLHDANSIPVNAGDSFYVEGGDEGAQVIIPSAL